MEKFTVKLTLSYDGTQYGGWQKQPSGKPTVQGELEKALFDLFQTPVTTIGAGRTDAGVHAKAQVAHFEIDRDPSEFGLPRSLNSKLPKDICINVAELAPTGFHSTRDAKRKTYIYRIWNSPTPSALYHRYHTWIRHPLSVEKLNSFSELLLGEQDFKSFQSKGTPVKSTVRTITKAYWSQINEGELEFQIEGTGFLKQMVRNIVGTLLELTLNKAPISELSEIISQKDRCSAKKTAPPQGLQLYEVLYSKELDNKCRKF